MKSLRLSMVITSLNLGILIFQLAQSRPVEAGAGAPPVLRAKALELVDDQGRVRVEMKVFPAQPTFKMPDATTGFPEAVQLRMITSKGGPNVKLVATEDGSGLVLGGRSGYVQVLSRGEGPFVKIANTDARQQVIKQQVVKP